MSFDSKFSESIQADSNAYYMSCPESVGQHLADRLTRYESALELCCAVGTLSIQLAKRIKHVTGVDQDPRRVEMARYNARLYGVDSQTDFIVGDVLNKKLLKGLKADVVILDPDWSIKGEADSNHVTDLSRTQPDFVKLLKLTRDLITENVVARLPKTVSNERIRRLGNCEIEDISWGGRPRFKIAYYLRGMKGQSQANFPEFSESVKVQQ